MAVFDRAISRPSPGTAFKPLAVWDAYKKEKSFIFSHAGNDKKRLVGPCAALPESLFFGAPVIEEEGRLQ